MLYWLSNSKVRLALLVNGLYLISLIAPSSSSVGGRPYPHDYERTDFGRRPVSITLPPSAGPTKATSYRNSRGDATIYLDKDLTLRQSRGRLLTLSPTFNTHGDDPPRSVLLHFISHNTGPALTIGTELFITADGRRVWPALDADGRPVWKGWVEQPVPPSVTEHIHGGVVENVGKSIPYEVFAEVVAAKGVVFNIGPYVVKLTDEQLEALRDMHRLWAKEAAPVKD